MYRTIYKILDNNYHLINQVVPIIQYQPNLNFLHHLTYVDKKDYYTKKTFEGYLNCGAICYLVSYLLNQNKIDNKMVISNVQKDFKNFEHVFIMVGNYIIDPTYRQLFRDDEIHSDNFMKYLYNTRDYFFLGTYQQMEELCDNYKKMYIEENKIEPFDVLSHYQNYRNFICTQDLDRVIDDHTYAFRKGRSFLKVHEFFNK